MRIKLKKNPTGITGLPTVEASFTSQAGEGIALVCLHLKDQHPSGDTGQTLLASLRLSPSEARRLAARLIESADTADRLLRGQS